MSRDYLGEFRDGVVVFNGSSPALAPGTKVRVEPLAADDSPTDNDPMAGTRRMLLSWARWAERQGAPPLPSDLAENHDHYAHGKP